MQVSEFSFKLLILSLFTLAGCIDETDIPQGVIGGGVPVFSGGAVLQGRTASTITVSASLTQENGSKVVERGFVYGTSPSPTLQNGTNIAVLNSGIGEYSLTLSGLNGNTTYYIRPYATNASGTVYGSPDLVVSTNPGLGVVSTLPPSDVHATAAVSGGNIFDAGEGAIQQRGVYVSRTEDFSVIDTTVISSKDSVEFTCQITGLTADTKYYVKAFVTNTFGTFTGDTVSFTTTSGKGTVETLQPSGVTASQAFVGGKITASGEGAIIERGVYLYFTDDFTTPDSTVLSSKDSVEYVCLLTNLAKETKYYVKAFVTNTFGTFEGDTASFVTTNGLGAVETLPVSNLMATQATSGFKIIETGDGVILQRGVEVARIADFSAIDTIIICTQDTVEYECVLTDLLPGVQYFVRAYVTNTYGTFYGNVVTVTTDSGLGTVETLAPSDVYALQATCGGKITAPGEGAVLQRGVFVSLTKDFLVQDTALSVQTTDEYYCTVALSHASTKYYVKAFVTNAFGTFEGMIDSLLTRDGLPLLGITGKGVATSSSITLTSSASTNGDPSVSIIEAGFCWSQTPAPTIANDTIHCLLGVGGVFSGTLYALIPSRQYYARTYAITQCGIVYGSDEVTFTTLTDAPQVQTDSVSRIEDGRASLWGHIVDNGATPIMSFGFCYSTTETTPTVDNSSWFTVSAGNMGQLTNLKGATTYYFRFYARNITKIAYGEVRQFTTPPVFITSLAPFPGGTLAQKSPGFFTLQSTTGPRFYVLGGDPGSGATDALYYYSLSENIWVQQKPFTGGKVKWPICIPWHSGSIVFSGVDENSHEIPGLYYYNGDEANSLKYNTWENPLTVGDTLYLPTAVVSANSGSFFVIGGRRDTSSVSSVLIDTVKNTVWNCTYNPVGTSTWTQIADFPEKQYEGLSAQINGVVYAGMGRDTLGVCNNTLWKSTDDGATWTVQTVCTINTGAILGGIDCNNRIYLIDEDYRILEYYPATDTWTLKSQLPAAYHRFHCIYKYDGKLYIGLGTNNNILEYDIIWDN